MREVKGKSIIHFGLDKWLMNSLFFSTFFFCDSFVTLNCWPHHKYIIFMNIYQHPSQLCSDENYKHFFIYNFPVNVTLKDIEWASSFNIFGNTAFMLCKFNIEQNQLQREYIWIRLKSIKKKSKSRWHYFIFSSLLDQHVKSHLCICYTRANCVHYSTKYSIYISIES